MNETRDIIKERYPQTQVEIRQVDIANEASVDELYSFAVTQFGRIDYGANVAGIAQAATPIHLAPDEVFDKMYAINQKGVS